jgi:programmed cell death 6-interacting protein
MLIVFSVSFQSLLDIVQKNLARAERDNDLIYHQDIPAPSGISVIQEVSMVQSIIPPGLQDPRSIIGNESMIFGEMLGWGAREAISGLSDCVMRPPLLIN